ncbi:MAG: ABC transporter ATP-binding protein, partial [Candidatus Binatia bacterium]
VMVASLKRHIFFSITTALLTIGALIASTGAIVLFDADLGTMFLVITYTSLIAQRLWDFSQNTLRSYNRSLGDAKEMVETLGIKPDVTNPVQPERSRIASGKIVFDHMSFTHPDSHQDEILFKDLSLTIQPGEKIGLVGHSGSGKTTLARLLLRFADVDGGAIEIDGQNIAAITQDDLHRAIAYVPQEPLLFHRSLFENISYGKLGASKDEVIEAAKKAHAHEFITKLPHGYDTLVGERGVKLSGGQRQRVAIARAIIKVAPILVLDEATSALDSESERLIQASLRDLMLSRTAIVIAHRLSTIQKMDRIVVLDNGRIIEEGSHTHLLAKNGIYASLWQHQSGGFIEE